MHVRNTKQPISICYFLFPFYKPLKFNTLQTITKPSYCLFIDLTINASSNEWMNFVDNWSIKSMFLRRLKWMRIIYIWKRKLISKFKVNTEDDSNIIWIFIFRFVFLQNFSHLFQPKNKIMVQKNVWSMSMS